MSLNEQFPNPVYAVCTGSRVSEDVQAQIDFLNILAAFLPDYEGIAMVPSRLAGILEEAPALAQESAIAAFVASARTLTFYDGNKNAVVKLGAHNKLLNLFLGLNEYLAQQPDIGIKLTDAGSAHFAARVTARNNYWGMQHSGAGAVSYEASYR